MAKTNTKKKKKQNLKNKIITKERTNKYRYGLYIIFGLIIIWIIALLFLLFKPNDMIVTKTGLSYNQILMYVIIAGIILVGNSYCLLSQWYYFYLNKHNSNTFDRFSVYSAKYCRIISVALCIYFIYNIIETIIIIILGFIPQAYIFGGLRQEGYIIISITLFIYLVSITSSIISFNQSRKYFNRFLTS